MSRVEHEAMESRTLRLGPELGRTLMVNPTTGADLAGAIRSLEALCSRNRVRADARRDLFYVRKGQRRKVLRSQRWRELFKQGFKAEVSRVRRMVRQGW